MKELLPCPFCPGGEAGIQLYSGVMTYYAVECKDCYCSTGYEESEQEAKDIWNTRYEKPNEPLSKVELMQIDIGKSVWVEVIDKSNICTELDAKSDYGTIRPFGVRIWRWETADLVHSDFDLEDYNKTWLAYCYKPK